MARISRRCVAAFAVAVVLDFALVSTSAFAAVEMSIGSRAIVPNAPVSQCSAKAKSALNSVLQGGAAEAGENTGQWLSYGPADSSGNSSSAAAIHCYPIDHGYVATFTCAVESPVNPESASALCTKLTSAFGGGK